MAGGAVAARRRVPWWAIAIGVLVLLAGGLFAADNWVRSQISAIVSDRIERLLSLGEDHPVELEIDGVSVLAQLLTGRLEGVTAAVDNVELGELTGSVELGLEGIPIDAAKLGSDPAAVISGPVDAVRLRVVATEESVVAIARTLTLSVVQDVRLEDGLIRLSSEWSVIGIGLALGLAVEPYAVGGAVGFEPVELSVNGATTTVADLRERFGALADAVFQPREVCVARWLPKALGVESVAVEEVGLTLVIAADKALLDDASLRQLGSCG